jgi:rfaE bifunctional protein nucleotidyltransferase chain/domain
LNPSIITLDEAILRFSPEKRNARRVVLIHGCFDLLHPGHTRRLEQARELGDELIIGLYSDVAVRQLKGEGRPVLPQQERAEILVTLECVDAVVILNDVTPEEVSARLLPDVLVYRGGEAGDQFAAREKVEAAGLRVASVPVVPGYSTVAILRKIREGARTSRAES